MNRIHHLFITSAVATLMACSADPGVGDPSESVDVGTSQEAVTLADCQRQVASCTKGAKSLTDLGVCTVKFQACTTQAAADLVGQGTLLVDCRASANKCLEGAVSSLDISKCRGLFETCATDAAKTANGALTDAIGAAKTTVGTATQAAINAINAAGGAVDGALDAVSACVKESNACFTGATLVQDVTQCEKAAEACVNHAVTLVSDITDPLPGPNVGEIAGGLSQCQKEVTACLDKAITTVDIAACKGALTLCVNNTTGFVDQTVNDLNALLPPFFQLPAPTKPVDCTAAAAQCLLSMSNPLDCASQATTCLTQ